MGLCLALISPLPSIAQDDSASTGLSLIEAVEILLANDPNVALAKAGIDLALGSALSASGRFDPLVSATAQGDDLEIPLDGSGGVLQRQRVSTSFGLSKEFRTGLSINPQLDLDRVDDRGATAANSSAVSFTVRQPLLRNRGRETVAAGERAAEHDLAASRLDLEHTLAQRMVAVASTYWNVAAALLDLEILQISEASSRELLRTTRQLIAADLTPAAEQIQLEADLAAKEGSRIGGEATLFASLQDLGAVLGLRYDAISRLPMPSDRLPWIDSLKVPDRSAVDLFIREALLRRADLRAARERAEGAQRRLRAAENGLEPQLDLLFTPSYQGLDDGGGVGPFFSPLTQNVPGLSTTLSVRLSWPTLNRQARGAHVQSRASLEQRRLQVELASRQIEAEVSVALDDVLSSALRVEKTEEAERLFERAVDNEEKKLRAGRSTLIDVISQRDRLTASRQRRVQAQRALALALVQLRFQTGTLWESSDEAWQIAPQHFVALPFVENSE